ncbi:hypothetical protein L917_21466, partial [Phytophthora nicotianae]
NGALIPKPGHEDRGGIRARSSALLTGEGTSDCVDRGESGSDGSNYQQPKRNRTDGD